MSLKQWKRETKAGREKEKVEAFYFAEKFAPENIFSCRDENSQDGDDYDISAKKEQKKKKWLAAIIIIMVAGKRRNRVCLLAGLCCGGGLVGGNIPSAAEEDTKKKPDEHCRMAD